MMDADIDPHESDLEYDSDEDMYDDRRKRKHDEDSIDDPKPKRIKSDSTISFISENDDEVYSDDCRSDITDVDEEDEDSLKYFQFEHITADLYSNILEQVCLEGLDGITLEALWKRLIDSINCRVFLENELKEKVWNFLVNCSGISFYLLPEPRPDLVIFDRFQYLDSDLGMVVEPETYPINIYPHKCINDISAKVIGSCPAYYTRKDITDKVNTLSCHQAEKLHDSKLVIVANQLLRTDCLMKDVMDPLLELTEVQYCILERIGRSRCYGEITQGKYSLQEICNDAKMMFYNRRVLKRQHLINKQPFYLKTSITHHTTGSLLHLQRFYNQKKLKMQMITEKIVDYLRRSPEKVEYSNVRKRFSALWSIEKLLKTSDFQRFVQTNLTALYRELYPNADMEQWKVKGREKERRVRVLKLRDPSINVSAAWHEDNDEEESTDDESLGDICTNSVFLNQMYNAIYDAGPEGISVRDLETIAGIDYYTIRAILITLINRKCVTTYKIDDKRQKIIKYYASCFSESKNYQKDIEMYDRARKTAKINSLRKFRNAIKKPIKTTNLDVEIISLSRLNEENTLESIHKRTNEEPCVEILIENRNKKENHHKKLLPIFLNVHFVKEHDETIESLDEYGFTFVMPNKKKSVNCVTVTPKKNIKSKNVRYSTSKRYKISTPNVLLTEALQEGFDSVEEKLSTSPDLELREVMSDERLDEFDEKSVIFKSRSILGPKPLLVKHEFVEDKIELKILTSTKPRHYKPLTSSYDPKGKRESKRFIARANIVINTLKRDRIVVDSTKFCKIINEIERTGNYDVQVDRKSIERILNALVEDGHIKIIQIIIKCDNTTRIKNIICDPSISSNNSEIVSLTEQLKMKCFAASKRKNERMTELTQSIIIEEDASEKQKTTSTKPQQRRIVSKLIYDKKIGKLYGYRPKFIRMKLLHRFLFHVIYEKNIEILSDDDVKNFYESNNITFTTDEYNKYSRVYNAEMDWRMFVPPLTENETMPKGWALISDILLRLPLSLLVKLCNVRYQVPNLYSYLMHPIKRHILIKDLPNQTRNVLLHHRKYIHSIYETLVLLNGIGLLQFGPHTYKEKDQMHVFLNRRAMLYNTTTSEAGYRIVSEKEYEKIFFEFISQNDVKNYWLKMCSICLHTRLGNVSFIRKEAKYIRKDIGILQTRTFEDAPLRDFAYIPGDGKGAAGLDSSLWPHLKRNWMWSVPKEQKDIKKQRSEPSSSNVRERKTDKVNYKPIKYDELKRQHVKKLKVTSKLPLSPNTKKKRLKEKVIIEERKIREREKLVKMKRDQDLIDRKIMNRIAKCRVAWTKQEDQILILCKIVSKFLSRDSHKQLIPPFLIRDAVQRFCPKVSSNKTSRACLRRIAWLSKRSKKSGQNLKTRVDLLGTIPHVKTYYDEFKEDLKKEKVHKEKLFSKAFVHLINYLQKEDFNKLIKKTEQRNKIRDKLVSANLEKYYDPDLKPTIHDDVKSDLDISLDVIKSVVLSCLGSADGGDVIIRQFLSLNQIYSDDKLKEAINILRKQNVIVKNHSFSKSDSTSRPFRFSFNYIFAQITKYSITCYSQTHDFLVKLKEYLDVNPDPRFTSIFDVVKPFVQSHNIGLCELISLRSIDICVELPEEVLILNPSIEDHSEVIKELALRYKYITSRKHKTRKSTKIKELQDTANESDKNVKNVTTVVKSKESSGVTIKDIVEKVLRAYDTNSQQEREQLERSLELDMRIVTEKKQEEDVSEKVVEETTTPNSDDTDDKDEEFYSTDSESEDLPEPSVDDIMEGMMENKPEELRTIPHITDLTSLLTQGLIPELDKDAAWLEKLREHFVMICPTSKMLLEKNIFDDDTTNLIKNHEEKCAQLYEKLKTDFVIKKQPPVEFAEVESKLLKLGANDVDLLNTKNLMDFIRSRQHLGATSKEIKKNFGVKLGKIDLCSILDFLTEFGYIFRFGITGFRFVHEDFRSAWLMDKCYIDKTTNFQVDIDKTEHIRVMPWTQIDGSLNTRVILIWMCVILNQCLITPYASFTTLVIKYYFLKPVDIFYVLECLQTLGCLEMVTMKKEKVTLFSTPNSNTAIKEKATCLSDFNEIFIKCSRIAMTLFGGFINGIKDVDF